MHNGMPQGTLPFCLAQLLNQSVFVQENILTLPTYEQLKEGRN